MKKYTENAKKVLNNAETLSLYTGNIVESIHLLIAITENKDCYGAEILARLGFDFNQAKNYLIRTSLSPKNISVIVAPTTQNILDQAEIVAEKLIIDTHHILLALAYHKGCSASKILSKNNITYELLLSIVEGMNHNKIGEAQIIENSNKNSNIISDINTDKIDNIKEISQYGIDLTELAKQGKLCKIIDREKELERLIMILSRKRKNNPIIVGESGVGKTAIVEALAQKISANEVPNFLLNKTIFSVNLNSIVSGTKYRGEMEEKLSEILKFAENNGIILFIDEIHSAMSAGNTENGGSIASILKPAINNENIKIIGATTISEYSKYLEKDPAFERRFMKLTVAEPTQEKAFLIIKGIKSEFEKHYGLHIPDNVVEIAIRYSIRYMPNRYLPDKAIDVLDETCSRVSLYKYTEKNLTVEDVKVSITEMTGIPVNDNESEKILDLENSLKSKIIGQDEAISSICRAIVRSKSGLREGKKPIGSFIFLGTTGSGKTETAKVLAEYLFGSKTSLIRFDMSEYMEKNSVARLIGAPPGYVGYEEGGTLTESVKNKPYSIILFDEIEKANIDVYNVLLQVLDDGILTDGKGRSVDFRNTIIIMTSNAGTENLKSAKSVGFGEGNNVTNDEKELQISAIKRIMRPEFINRIDDIIVFNRLNKENLREIADIILKDKVKILREERGINLEFSADVAEYLVKKAYDAEYGARPLRRAVETLIENKLSEIILRQNLKQSAIKVSITNEEIAITVKK